jgi:tetratricopeptide (TPR) repeat protein
MQVNPNPNHGSRNLIDWLRLIAVESKSGLLEVRGSTATWKLYCVPGEILAVIPQSSALINVYQAQSPGQFIRSLVTLEINDGAQTTFTATQETPPSLATVLRLPLQNMLAELARSEESIDFIRNQLAASGSRFQAATRGTLEGRSEQLTSDEVFLLSRLESPLSIKECLLITPFGEEKTLHHLYILYLLGLIEPQGLRLASDPASPLSPPPPAERNPFPAIQEPSGRVSEKTSTDWVTLQREIEELIYLISHGNYYDLLSVSRMASEEEIKTAYLRLARRYHPDRYQATATQSVRAQLVNLFAHLSQANETLSDPDKRREYDQQLELPVKKKESTITTSQAPVSEKNLAEENYVVGRRLIDQGGYSRSLPYLREAVRLKPNVVRYRGTLARALSEVPVHRKEAEEHWLKAIELEPGNASHYAELGRLYKQVQLMTRARKLLDQALEIDPFEPVALAELGRTPAKGAGQKKLGNKLKKLFGKKG